MRPLINPAATIFLKCSYVLPIFAYAWGLAILEHVHSLDILALFFTTVGTILAFLAKHHLGENHSWAGYYLEGNKRIRCGIYCFLDHPMYLGIVLMIVGGAFVFLPRLPMWQSVIASLFIVYVVIYLLIVSRREDMILESVEADDV